MFQGLLPGRFRTVVEPSGCAGRVETTKSAGGLVSIRAVDAVLLDHRMEDAWILKIPCAEPPPSLCVPLSR